MKSKVKLCATSGNKENNTHPHTLMCFSETLFLVRIGPFG